MFLLDLGHRRAHAVEIAIAFEPGAAKIGTATASLLSSSERSE
jgi:hypothetical protein